MVKNWKVDMVVDMVSGMVVEDKKAVLDTVWDRKWDK